MTDRPLLPQAQPEANPACPVCQGEPQWEHDARTGEWAGRCVHCAIEGVASKTKEGAKRAWSDWYSKYATPQAQPAPAVPAVQPLTDEQIDEIWDGTFESAGPKRQLSFRQTITRAAIAKFCEVNSITQGGEHG